MLVQYCCENCGKKFDTVEDVKKHEEMCKTTYDVKEIQLGKRYEKHKYSYAFSVSIKKWSKLIEKPKEDIRGEIGDYWAFTVDMSEEMEKSLKKRLLRAALNDGEAAIERLQQFQWSAKELAEGLK